MRKDFHFKNKYPVFETFTQMKRLLPQERNSFCCLMSQKSYFLVNFVYIELYIEKAVFALWVPAGSELWTWREGGNVSQFKNILHLQLRKWTHNGAQESAVIVLKARAEWW